MLRPDAGHAADPGAMVVRPDVDVAQQSVDITDQQLAAFRVLPAEDRPFRVIKNAVGSIDFNQNMLVQAFTPNPGKIVETHLNVGDEVKKGETLFTIDSPDLLQAESTMLASAGVLARRRARWRGSSSCCRPGAGRRRMSIRRPPISRRRKATTRPRATQCVSSASPMPRSTASWPIARSTRS